MLDVFDKLPAHFMTTDALHISEVCPRPTLIHLRGRRQPALFVSILLHGNEDVGLLAIQEILGRYQDRQLPRDLSIFVGNVEACAAGVRYLPHQPDFNRVWPGSELPTTAAHELMSQVTREVLERGVFVSLDLHNNTGRNPIYGCICHTAPEQIYLASMFSRTVVYFTRPRGVQTQAFTPYCPSLTCECGQIGDPAGVERAVELIDACLHLSEFPHHPLPEGDVHIFHTVARIKLRDDCSFGFSEGTDIVLRQDLDALNFVELSTGESIGSVSKRVEECFLVQDESGCDVTAQFFETSNHQLRLSKPAMPSMFTCNLDVIRQDCLGYLMERLPTTHP